MPTTKTRYPNVYRDSKGQYFYQIFLGRDAFGKNNTMPFLLIPSYDTRYGSKIGLLAQNVCPVGSTPA